MAKSLYAGVNGTAKKAKKIYVGDGTARKVKKIYVGDSNNIARQTFSLDERKMNVSAYGYLADLPSKSDTYISSSAEYNTNTGIFDIDTGSIGGYAVFTGGYETHWDSNMGSGTYANKFDHGYTTYYSPSLVRSYNETSYGKTEGTASANVGNYLLFAGGANNTGNMGNTMYTYPSSTVYAMNSSLAVQSISSLSVVKRFAVNSTSNSGCSVGKYALFPGGEYIVHDQYGSHQESRKEVECYLEDLTKISATSLSSGGAVFACSAGSKKYCIIHEGPGYTSSVCSFDTSLTKKSCSTLYVYTCHELKYASVGDYIIGLNLKSTYDNSSGSNYYSMVAKYIDSSLTLHSISSSSTPVSARRNFTGCTGSDMAAFVGGNLMGTSTFLNEAYFYNSSLTMTKISSSYSACGMSCVSTGDYIIQASGQDSGDQTRACKYVYAYKLS